jgi:hypothetical protein
MGKLIEMAMVVHPVGVLYALNCMVNEIALGTALVDALSVNVKGGEVWPAARAMQPVVTVHATPTEDVGKFHDSETPAGNGATVVRLETDVCWRINWFAEP